MNKLTMAHEYALKMLENLNPMQMKKPTRDGIAYECFELAEAMQAEADKRNNKETCDKNIGLDSSVLKPSLPKDEISGFFINIETNDVIYSESDIISHDWRRIPDNVDFVALRLVDSKMFFCVAGEVDEGKFKVIWKRPQ